MPTLVFCFRATINIDQFIYCLCCHSAVVYESKNLHNSLEVILSIFGMLFVLQILFDVYGRIVCEPARALIRFKTGCIHFAEICFSVY